MENNIALPNLSDEGVLQYSPPSSRSAGAFRSTPRSSRSVISSQKTSPGSDSHQRLEVVSNATGDKLDSADGGKFCTARTAFVVAQGVPCDRRHGRVWAVGRSKHVIASGAAERFAVSTSDGTHDPSVTVSLRPSVVRLKFVA
jgi:hypothetical protein